MKAKVLIISVILYVVSTLFSYLLFAKVISGNSAINSPIADPKKVGEKLVFDDAMPKTEECPLNGALYSKQQRKWWEQHRPLGVMVENHEEARPQSGLSRSDIVYEAVAEGGITRFLSMFYCQNAEVVGPVRSARTYFIDFVSEYGDHPLYAHVGGANTDGPADALGQIEKYGWALYNDLNQFSFRDLTFKRIYGKLKRADGGDVATEHTMYASTTGLWSYANKQRDLSDVDKKGEKWDGNFMPYSFKDDPSASSRPASQSVSFNFWEGYGSYAVKWNYDSKTNSYLRENGGVKHADMENKEQLSAKNVVLLFMRESRANDGYEGNLHMLYGTKGTGNALIFRDGEQIKGTWSKKDRISRTILRDNKGQEIKFTRGRIWFEILGAGTDVSVN